jgi:hypothetical protein
MMRWNAKAWVCWGVAASLLACGQQLRLPSVAPEVVTQRELEFSERSLRLFLDSQIRVAEIGYRIRLAGAELCGEEIAPMLGVVALRRTDLRNRQLKKLGQQLWALTHDYRVMHVVEGSVAERAGVKVDDRILRLGGVRVGKSSEISEVVRASKANPLRLTVLRDGQSMDLDLERIEGCYHRVWLSPSSRLLTSATDEEELIIPMGIVRIARSDDEIALAIGHQLGHQLLPELDDDLMDPPPGELLKAESELARREVEADRLGLYLAARAGFDLSGFSGYLERVAIEEPWRLFYAGGWVGWGYWGSYRHFVSHGFIPRRIVALQRVIDEISLKQSRGEPLIPERPEGAAS